jgi:mannose-6-phosphate isomerase-like protein (cupin superfamily)
MKKGYKDNLEELTLANENFRQVIYTAKNCQLVLMSLAPGEEIGLETHEGGDQFFRFEIGNGEVVINETKYAVHAGDAVIVPMGAMHNVVNTSKTETLKLYTLYTPPHHKDGIVRLTKADTVNNSPEWSGETTE